MTLGKTYYSFNLLIAILAGCLLFSCRTNDKIADEKKSRIGNGLMDTFGLVLIENTDHMRVLDTVFAMIDSVKKNPAIKIDTRKFDSVVNARIEFGGYAEKIDDKRRDSIEDEIKYIDKAHAFHAAIDSFYKNELPTFSKIIQSPSTDRYELARDLLNRPLTKIKRRLDAFLEVIPEMEKKYKFRIGTSGTGQWNLNRTIGEK